MAKTMKKGKCIHRFSNATKVINKGHLEFFSAYQMSITPKMLCLCRLLFNQFFKSLVNSIQT